MNNSDLEAPNPGCNPKLDITVKPSLKSGCLFEMLFQDQQRCLFLNKGGKLTPATSIFICRQVIFPDCYFCTHIMFCIAY